MDAPAELLVYRSYMSSVAEVKTYKGKNLFQTMNDVDWFGWTIKAFSCPNGRLFFFQTCNVIVIGTWRKRELRTLKCEVQVLFYTTSLFA